MNIQYYPFHPAKHWGHDFIMRGPDLPFLRLYKVKKPIWQDVCDV